MPLCCRWIALPPSLVTFITPPLIFKPALLPAFYRSLSCGSKASELHYRLQEVITKLPYLTLYVLLLREPLAIFFTTPIWDTFGTDLLFEVRMKQSDDTRLIFFQAESSLSPSNVSFFSPPLSFTQSSILPDKVKDTLLLIFLLDFPRLFRCKTRFSDIISVAASSRWIRQGREFNTA